MIFGIDHAEIVEQLGYLESLITCELWCLDVQLLCKYGDSYAPATVVPPSGIELATSSVAARYR
jgi:hypothetical protein